jgi:hypothetical protein
LYTLKGKKKRESKSTLDPGWEPKVLEPMGRMNSEEGEDKMKVINSIPHI